MFDDFVGDVNQQGGKAHISYAKRSINKPGVSTLLVCQLG